MANERFLIVNADDYGLSPGVNRGIMAAHEHGIVTSASLMVRGPAAAEAAVLARAHPRLSLGLHVDLCEWAFKDENWIEIYEVVSLADRAAVEKETARQLDVFRQLVGRDPSHIDSHQHVHWEDPVRSVLSGIACELHVPLRHFSPKVAYCGSFYGQTGKGYPLAEAIGVDALLQTLAALPPGFTELACHPGEDDLDCMYGAQRAEEVATLCDPRIREALSTLGIELRSFASLGDVR